MNRNWFISLVSAALLCFSAATFANTDYLTEPTFNITPVHDTIVVTADLNDPGTPLEFTSEGDLVFVSDKHRSIMYSFDQFSPGYPVKLLFSCSDDEVQETKFKVPIAI